MNTRKYKFQNKELSLILQTDADQSVFREIFLDREYKELEPIIQNAKDLILDIGGHIGLFSLYAATLNPNVEILTFEPDRNNFETLKEHLKINKIKNVKARNLAISDSVGTINLYISPDSHNHSIYGKGESQVVNSTNLTKILNHKPHCNLAKIDCEGAEFPIIKETPEETLKKICHIYIEYHYFDPTPLTQKLQSSGFKTKSTASRYQKDLGFIIATNQ